MATLNPVIQKKSLRKDGTWNVKIRLGHKGEEKFIDTNVFVGKKQVDKNFKIKDAFAIGEVLPDIKKYQERIERLGPVVNHLTAAQLKDSIVLNANVIGDSSAGIDFLKFCQGYIERLKKEGKIGSSKNMATVVNSLSDYFKTPAIPITDINYHFLIKYEAYLRSARKFMRLNHDGEAREYSMKPIGDAGLHNHMRDLRLMFNEARDAYNDEDSGIIRIVHYPFKKYKVSSPPLTEHRDKTVDELQMIRDAEVPAGTRAELARDLFMLSFYLCGMNAADLYELPSKIGDRVNYNRAKTRNKRRDKAYISVKVIESARPLLSKYAGMLQKRYSATSGLNHALDKGLKELSKITGIEDLDFYSARHSFGTLARNKCGFSTEDVAIAMNHKERTVTDIYIAPDWSTVDRVQEAVTKLL